MALCGCYYHIIAVNQYHPRPRQYLPLLNSSAHTTILATTSTTTLKQTFTNPSSTENIKECTYTFPLYDGVSVVGFTCRIGAKVLTGLVKEKVEAKKIFDEAVARGETAGFLEQAPEASDVFSTKLGNIPAGQSVVVEITYIGELKHHETEGIRFTIPTSIAPRYGAGPTTTSSGPVQDGDGIKITVDVNMPEGSFIKGVQSPSHPIAVSMGTISTATQADPVMSKASATLSLGSAALEKDFVLIVQSKDVGIPKALLETHPTIPNHRAIMATLVPKFSLPPARPEIVFLADRSGSMGGTSITMLISAMKVFLKSLPAGVKFNVGSFGSNTSFLWNQSKSYTSETLKESTAHVESFTANMGGTETFEAIRATVDRRFSDLPLEIILLTDGDIWRQEELFQYVNEQVASSGGKIRIFPLGIGNGVSHALIEGLARAGNGFAQAVQSGERMDNSVVRMLRGALSPHITDYTIEVKYEQNDDDDFEVIDSVTDGMKVLLTDIENEKGARSPAKEQKAIISLFDPTVNPEKDDVAMKDADAGLPKVPYPKLLQAPHKIPSLFAFSRTTVYLLMSPKTIQRNPTSVVLRATSTQGPLSLEIPIEVLAEPAQTIHQLAAKKAVQDLEEGRGWIFDAKDKAGKLVKDRFPSCFDDLVKREAVRLGEKFQVAGKWCSFVAVAANDKEIVAKRDQSRNSAANDGVEFGDDEVLQNFDFDTFISDDLVSEDQSSPLPPPPSYGSAASYSSPPGSARRGGAGSTAAPARDRAAYQQQHMLLQQQNTGRLQMARSAGAAQPPAPPLAHPISRPHGMFASKRKQGAASPPSSESVVADGSSLRSETRVSSLSSAAPSKSAQAPAIGGGLFGNSPSPPPPHSSILSGDRSSTVESRSANVLGRRMHEEKNNKDRAAPSPKKMTKGGPPLPPSPAMDGRFSAPAPAPMAQPSQQSPVARFAARIIPSAARKRERAPGSESEEPVARWEGRAMADKVLRLIELQEFEGSWVSGGEVLEILGLAGLPPRPGPDGAVVGDEKVWITMLVVRFLEVRAAAEEGTWSMVVEKARGWLGCSAGLEGLEGAAGEVFGRE